MASYVRKTKDVWCIETNYGYGWEVESTYDTRKEAVSDLAEYQLMVQSFKGQVRIKKRREKIA